MMTRAELRKWNAVLAKHRAQIAELRAALRQMIPNLRTPSSKDDAKKLVRVKREARRALAKDVPWLSWSA
jgi:hypothetical protein